MNNKYIYSIIICLASYSAQAQEATRKYSLFELVQTARTQSPSWLQAETLKENKYWEYKTYKSNYSPQLTLEGTLPNYQRSFSSVQQNDGSYIFQPLSNNRSNLSLQLNQVIGATGTRIFMSSSAQRFDDFDRDFTQFNGAPIQVGVYQPIFQFNTLKWDKKIEPLKYEESKKQYFEDLEQISIDVTERYFNLLLAQINLTMANKNLSNNDTIYRIAQGRFQLGKIGENDLLQLEANLINSELDVSQAQLNHETSTLELKAFIGFKENQALELLLTENIPQFDIDEERAILEAKKNRVSSIAFRRRVLEGERGVARAKGDNGVKLDLNAAYGLNNRGDAFSSIYDNPNDQQSISLNLSVPIVDWGRQKARIKTAQANQKYIEYQVQQEQLNFEQEVLTKVKNFKLLRKQLKVRKKSDDIEQRKYYISKELFLIGKIDITTLNIALKDKDAAKRNYITSLKDFWTGYFEIRKLTLYDFEKNSLLVKDLE